MKKLFGVVFAVVVSLIFTSQVSAQTVTPPPATYPLNTNSNVPQDFHAYTQNVFIEILSTATCFVGGADAINPQRPCLGFDNETKKIGYVESSGGLTGIMGSMIGATFTIPVSGGHYAKYLASNFGFSKNTYAAIPAEEGGSSTSTSFGTGIGFHGLSPVLKIWESFRNLTYLFFVLVFILLGLGIMFRLNIDARTVMTIQNQIPKVIIALVLITLSYAIAGFLIDMMYVIIYLVIHTFDSQGLATLTNIDTNPVMAIGPLKGIHGIAGPAASGVGGIIASMFEGSIGSWVGGLVGAIIGSYLGSALLSGVPLGGSIGALAGGLIGIFGGSKLLGIIAMAIAYLIICLAILSALFRVWFMLIKAYVYIFLDVIFAPFWIIGGILPGAPGGIGPWIRSLCANLAAFPAVILLFMIGKTIQEQASNVGGNFVPPLIGDPGANSGGTIVSLIGLGIILIMPEAVNITKKAFKAPEMKYSAAVGRAISAGSGLATSPIKGAWSKAWGQDAHGHDRYLTRKLGERYGRVASALSGGSFDNVVKNKDDTKSYRRFFGGHTDKDGKPLPGSKRRGLLLKGIDRMRGRKGSGEAAPTDEKPKEEHTDGEGVKPEASVPHSSSTVGATGAAAEAASPPEAGEAPAAPAAPAPATRVVERRDGGGDSGSEESLERIAEGVADIKETLEEDRDRPHT